MLRQVKSATPIYPVRATPALESTAAAPVRRELLRSLRFESSALPATGVGHKVNDTCCPSEGLRPPPDPFADDEQGYGMACCRAGRIAPRDIHAALSLLSMTIGLGFVRTHQMSCRTTMNR
ncbi:hypothetical protein CBI38_31465 (plasmid) [Rhodococcus oxybenzonivorans]|uniref:Uncharacterized protein n=1 Tax=Rhodococcus oxybenzonivorans TaxID=1990687 RepID=A0A2S2C5F3_9NOCA|nr:hypothetical protein CBI38_31465 [Rhodococcus oxybenzonivorans]